MNICTVGCAVVTTVLLVCDVIIVFEVRLFWDETTVPIDEAEAAELDTATDGVLLTGGCCFFLSESCKRKIKKKNKDF